MAIDHDLKGAAMFGLAAVITQVVAAELSVLLLSKSKEILRLNGAIIILSAVTTSFLAYRYLTASNEDALYFSGFPAECGYIIASGILMTFLSTVRLPILQGQITQLQCKSWLKANNVPFKVYISAVGAGTLLAELFYIGLGYFLSGHWKTYNHYINLIIGAALSLITVKRLIAMPVWRGRLKNIRMLVNHFS